jgi:hypothetical protein
MTITGNASVWNVLSGRFHSSETRMQSDWLVASTSQKGCCWFANFVGAQTYLAKQAQAGIEEAAAPKIES